MDSCEKNLLGEPVVFGLVVKGNMNDIQHVKQLLNDAGVEIVYKTLSYAPLYITTIQP